MKLIATSITLSTLLAALAVAQPPRYSIRDLGPLGPAGGSYFIADNGLISGAATMPDGTLHANLWYEGWRGDFGPPAFGGTNSSAYSNNRNGQFVGQAETSISEPNGEDFCGFKTLGLPSRGTTCVPFLWQSGVMTPLPTLGGPNGMANWINNAGQAVGWAENNTKDPHCPAPQVLQFKPVIWANGKVQELPTLAGDSEGVAASINDNGQAVGSSGTCAAFDPNSGLYLTENHAVLWQNGTVTDLGNLGGTGANAGNHACAMNNQGQVVGHSELPNGTTFHSFLWAAATGMRDLGTLPGDFASNGNSINDRGEVVGLSLDENFNPRAFLWENGVMMDLNTLIPANSALYLLLAFSINSSGEIVGLAATSSGDLHGFRATPSSGADARENAAPVAQGMTHELVLSEDVRKLLQRQLGFARFGSRLVAPR